MLATNEEVKLLSEASESRATIERMGATLAQQRLAHLEQGPPSFEQRIDRLGRMHALVVDNQKKICDAMAADYVVRAAEQTMLADIVTTAEGIKHARKHLRNWMRPARRSPNFPLGALGAKAHVQYQPLGVVGNIVPWNFPVYLTFGPLTCMLAAGNRAMVKMSEFVPHTAALVENLVASAFDEREIAVFRGGPDVGAAFGALPFDHLFFTGSPRVGKLVMRAASENLTPVTLELGGKSPVVIGRSADLAVTARRVAWGKTINGGQVCLAPDYVLVPEELRDAFVAALELEVARMYPTMRDNPQYTSIINELQHRRVRSYLDDARARGVEAIEINPAGEDFAAQRARKMPVTVLLDPPDDALVMQNEIFGPLLPVKTYKTIDEALAFVNARPRPLALYYFGQDRAEAGHVLSRTTSGGACVNEVMVHAMQDDLPFGGCGNSGMGAYHGEQGFRTFSHAKSVFTATRRDPFFLLRPPYGKGIHRLFRMVARPR
jgi:coniferyl-aldehyde dehydrogenase